MQSDQPGTFLRRRGMAGVGDFSPTFQDPSGFDFQSAISAVNAEGIYLLNLYRIQQGLPPIPPQNAAPTFNVGLTAPVMIGIALLAYMVFRK